ncbi:hypothetical protein BJX76DRAFT_331034 [Aspergillus varians]
MAPISAARHSAGSSVPVVSSSGTLLTCSDCQIAHPAWFLGPSRDFRMRVRSQHPTTGWIISTPEYLLSNFQPPAFRRISTSGNYLAAIQIAAHSPVNPSMTRHLDGLYYC